MEWGPLPPPTHHSHTVIYHPVLPQVCKSAMRMAPLPLAGRACPKRSWYGLGDWLSQAANPRESTRRALLICDFSDLTKANAIRLELVSQGENEKRSEG